MSSENAPSKPLISVVLPTHNRADVLPYAIQSLLNQSLSDFELFVVGDGCTDNTAEVVASFDDPRITWLDLPKGPFFGYANRNMAFRRCSGEFIAFMAHDDIVFPDHLERLVAAFDAPEVDMVYSRPVWVSRSGICISSYFNLQRNDLYEAFMARRAQEIPASCVMHRRSCFDRYGLWDDSLERCADWDYWIKILAGGGRGSFRFVSVPTVLHFVAVWRRSDQIPGGVFRLQQRAEEKENSFIAVSLPLVPELPEQRCVWEQMMADPEGWVPRFRSDLVWAQDAHVGWAEARSERLARDLESERQRVQEQRTLRLECERSLKDCERALERVREEEAKERGALAEKLQRTAATLASIEGSRGWRCLNKLRNVRAFVRSRFSRVLPS